MVLLFGNRELLFSNFASSTLFSGISAADTTVNVQAGDGELFPTMSDVNQYLIAILEDDTANKEIVKVTARVGDVFTIERAQEGTLARAYTVNSRFELRLTSNFLEQFIDGRSFVDEGTRIRVSRSENTGEIPAALDLGEIALNIVDKILFIGDSGGNVVSIPVPNLGYLDWAYPAAEFVAVSGGRYFVSSLSIGNILLPPVPDIGRPVKISDLERSWDGSTTVLGNGNDIDGSPSISLDYAGDSLEFSFDGTEWNTTRVVNGTWGLKNARVDPRSADYTLVPGNNGEFIPFDTTTGDLVFTLLSPVDAGEGFRFETHNTGAGANTLTVDGTVLTNGVAATFWCDGVTWFPIVYGAASVESIEAIIKSVARVYTATQTPSFFDHSVAANGAAVAWDMSKHQTLFLNIDLVVDVGGGETVVITASNAVKGTAYKLHVINSSLNEAITWVGVTRRIGDGATAPDHSKARNFEFYLAESDTELMLLGAENYT